MDSTYSRMYLKKVYNEWDVNFPMLYHFDLISAIIIELRTRKQTLKNSPEK